MEMEMEMEMEMDTEMEIAVSPTSKDSGNYSDESTTTSSDSSSGTGGGSFSPLLKRLLKAKASMDITMTTADDDSDGKTSSTRSSISSISEEFGEPQAVAVTRSSISEEFGEPLASHQPSDPAALVCEDSWISLIHKKYPQPQPNIETFEVDHKWLACYAREALDYFKKKTGEVYRYEGPRSMCLCSLPDSEYKVTHINFFARPHGKFSESLFFAALEHGPTREVLECCNVGLFKAGDGVVPYIKHPPEVDCSECSKFGDAVLCFEVEEEPCCMWSSYSSVV